MFYWEAVSIKGAASLFNQDAGNFKFLPGVVPVAFISNIY